MYINNTLNFSYFTIQPVMSPASSLIKLENLLAYVDYQLVVRINLWEQREKEHKKMLTLTSDTLFFNTACMYFNIASYFISIHLIYIHSE